MALARKDILRACRYLMMMYLVVSTSKIMVRAQEVTLDDDKYTPEQKKLIADMLTNVFKGIAMDATRIQSPGADLKLPEGKTPAEALFDITQNPGIARVLNLTSSTSGQGVAQVLGDMLAQQQTAGNIAPLENAAKRVALFLDLPNTVGTGTNIQAFLARVDELRTIALQVKSYLNHEQFRQISAVLLTAAQLGLQSVTIPLAYLAFAIGLIALGAAITGLVAGVFYILASALAVAAVLTGAPALAEGGAAAETQLIAASTGASRSSMGQTFTTSDQLSSTSAVGGNNTAGDTDDDVSASTRQSRRPKGDANGPMGDGVAFGTPSYGTAGGFTDVLQRNDGQQMAAGGPYVGSANPEPEVDAAAAVRGTQWYQGLTSRVNKLNEPLLALAFSNKTLAPINVAMRMLDATDGAFAVVGNAVGSFNENVQPTLERVVSAFDSRE